MDAWTYDKIDEAVQILADIADSLKRFADFYTPIPSKDEPNSSEKPNNCEELNAYRKCVESRSFWDNKHCDGCYFDERCPFDEPKDEPTISKMEQVDKDINVRSKERSE